MPENSSTKLWKVLLPVAISSTVVAAVVTVAIIQADFFGARDSNDVPRRSPNDLTESKEIGISSSEWTSTFANPTVMTSGGLVEGSKIKNFRKDVYGFFGVPYARPPVGELRFKRPQPVKPWPATLLANDRSVSCMQPVIDNIASTWTSKLNVQSEDCLYLNIWTPELVTKEPKTVMVWLHGGGFWSGSINLEMYNGETLSAVGDAVIVSVNYRLGAFGFLNLGIDEAAGNMGMYDQAMALNWIKSNIKAFGGNPNDIVLFGQSAGAISAGLHMFSPMTRDLFHRVIMQSGSPLFPKVYYDDSLTKSGEYAQLAGCAMTLEDTFAKPDDVLRCLKEQDAQSLVASQESLIDKYKMPFFPYPDGEFLLDLPHDQVADDGMSFHQTDILLGNNQNEGSLFLHFFLPDVFKADRYPHNLTSEEAKLYIQKAFTFLPALKAKTLAWVLLEKFANSQPDVIVQAMCDMIGDSAYICPSTELSRILSKGHKVNVYHYLFTHRPSNSNWGKWMGSTHLDEIPFVFGLPIRFPRNYTSDEVEFSYRMMATWVNFAKTGKVSSQFGTSWPRYTGDRPVYMELNPSSSAVDFGPREISCASWSIFYESY